MSEDNILSNVKTIVVDQLDASPDQVTPEAKFVEDLGADSLDVVEMIMALEQEFDISISDDEAEKLQSVGDVVNYIKDALDE